MGRTDTGPEGARESFPETTWSSILSCADPASPARGERLNRLFGQYWRPVYGYIRAGWGNTVEDAKDMAQAFFCHVLESDLVSRYVPRQGRFRHFLKGALRNFLANERRNASTQARGSGRAPVSLDGSERELEEIVADRGSRTPEELFDLQWGREVMERALAQVRADLSAEGKLDFLAAYEAYELSAEPDISYEQVAARLGLPVSDVRNHLHQVRTRLRAKVLAIISDYVASWDDALDEFRELFAG